MTFSHLRDDLMIRVWGGYLESYKCYCFDFVNCERQYILIPDEVKIYTVETAFSPSAQVLSMEDYWKRRMRSRYTPTQPGVIPTGRLPSFVKAPFSVLRSRTTRIVSSTYPSEPLMIPLWFSSPGECDVSGKDTGDELKT